MLDSQLLRAAVFDEGWIELHSDRADAFLAQQLQELAATAAEIKDVCSAFEEAEVDALTVNDEFFRAAEQVLETRRPTLIG